MKRSIRTWAASVGVVLMAAGAVSLVATPSAQAAASDVTLTFVPAKGLDNAAPKVHLAGPCPAGSEEYVAYVSAPDTPLATPTLITVPSDADLSTEQAFDVQLGQSILDLTVDAGGTAVVPAYYEVTVTCRDKLLQTPLATFTGYMHFYTATNWQAGPDVYPGSTTEVIPTATPTPTATTATPTPTATTATPDPTATTDPTEDPTTDPTDSATPTTSTSPASSDQLPVTGPPAGGLFALGVALILLGGCVVLGTMRFDRPQPARW